MRNTLRNILGQFIIGHKKIGGFGKGSKHNQESKDKIGELLKGKFGEQSRRWKGEKATYFAKHMWILKHYGKASFCENDSSHTSWKFQWANISKQYHRNINDYKQLCISCHRLFDRRMYCVNGHAYTESNTHYTKKGSHVCRKCKCISTKKWRIKEKT